MQPSLLPTSCSVALKEWHATIGALSQGRQIFLLRKGGIHDAGGVFELEQRAFWLLPTWLHQNPNLLQAEHRDLLQPKPRETKTFALKSWAQVEQVWALDEAAQNTLESPLARARHIWSDDYLDIRFAYKPEHPLLCVALRVYESATPHIVEADPKYFGCRSWIEMSEELSLENLAPALSDEEFARHLDELQSLLGQTSNSAMR